jgi:sulfite exporter TauE/SafE
MEIKIKKNTLLISALVISILLIGFLLLRINSLEHPSATTSLIPKIPQGINLWAIFLTGLITGGLTCLAVQGGLLAATIAQREEQKLTDKTKNTGNALPILSFLIAKLIAYTALGFLLGWLGSVVQLSLTAKVFMQFAVVIFMFGTALNILNVHPIFRYFAIQPPKFLTRLVRKQSKRADLFAPILLGAFTVFIPCGTTQAMMALAIGSGSPLLGAATLFAFILGTSPLFFILGYFATKLGDAMHQKFMRFAAIVLILLALYNLDGALALSGSNFTFGGVWQSMTSPSQQATGPSTQQTAGNDLTVNFTRTGYTPNYLSVKAGSQVTLHLNNSDGSGCIQAFTIPSYGIQKVVQVGSSDSVQFTAPTKPTTIAFMCSMGMYRGFINVI